MRKGVEVLPEDNYRVRNEDMFDTSQGNPQDFGKKVSASKDSSMTKSTTSSKSSTSSIDSDL